MNVIREIDRINQLELDSGIKGSWHDAYKHSAYVYVGGLPFQLTEGDVLCVFSQYGNIADIDLIRDKETGKSKGFAFIKYEDQRSTVLAVDNFNGIQLLGRRIRVDHCQNYSKARPKPNKDGLVDPEELKEWEQQEAAKERALKFGEGLPELSSDEEKLETDAIGSGTIDPYLQAKKEKDQAERRVREEEERVMERLSKEMGLDEEDPMRNYYLQRELKRAKKEKRGSKRHRSRDSDKYRRRHDNGHLKDSRRRSRSK